MFAVTCITDNGILRLVLSQQQVNRLISVWSEMLGEPYCVAGCQIIVRSIES